MKFWTLILLLSSFVPGSSYAQASYPCGPAPEIRQALNGLPSMADYRIPFEQRMKPLRALLEKYPRDLFVQRRYQDTFRQKFTIYQEFDRALAMYRSKPGDPIFRYLEARLTAGFDTAKAEAMLNDLIAKEPNFPWPHLTIAELTDRSGARDAKKAETHLRAFLAACPSSVEGWALLRTVEDPEMIRNGATRLRALLEARVDSWSLPYWRYLWDLEFRSAPKDQQEPVRQRVLKDVAVLQKLPPEASREWNSLFQYAATLTKDQGVLSWLEETVLKQFPTSPLAASVESARWLRAHPRPGRDAKPEEMKEYLAIERAWTEEFQKRWPEDSNVIWDRWMMISGGSATLPADERLAIADAFAAMMRRSPDAGSMTPTLPIALARLYVQWQARLDQVPGLIADGLRDAELENKYQRDSSLLAEEIRKSQSNPVAWSIYRAQLTLAELYLLQNKLDQARDAIQIGLANVERRPLLPPGSDFAQRDADDKRRSWLCLQGRLAELEGDPLKALALYQSFLQPYAKWLSGKANAVPAPELSNQIAEIKKFYLANGGKEESWLEWVASAPKPDSAVSGPERLRYDVMLANFEAKDLNGKTWRLADLKGKATFIDIWATWCGVCRAQHPELQKLYDSIKGRRDIQVLSFSRDEAAYPAESYMKEKKYGFPVIVSKDLVEKLFPVAGLPMYWIIDAQGRRSSPYRWFISVDRVIADLQEAAAKK
jgi:thiol-disulfide isomerase/thioredoxin